MPFRSFFALSLVLASTTALAAGPCAIQGPDRAVWTVEVDDDALNAGSGAATLAAAERIVARASGCTFQDLNFGRQGSRCVEFSKSAPAPVCYLEAAMGTFIVTHDFLGYATVIFSRWD